jgi:hypothetical protein
MLLVFKKLEVLVVIADLNESRTSPAGVTLGRVTGTEYIVSLSTGGARLFGAEKRFFHPLNPSPNDFELLRLFC